MKRLTLPDIDMEQLLTDCTTEVGDLALSAKYLAHRPQFAQAVADFEIASQNATWCTLPRVPQGNPARVIFGTVTKGELTTLYSKYMVGSKGSARQTYDKILVIANGKCPFCGGIGHVKTLDHYVPKSYFPQFSICPRNLVPCCRDCNTGKLSAFPTVAYDQGIHPYSDGPHFFDERWVVANVLATDPIGIRFVATPPLYGHSKTSFELERISRVMT